MQECYQIPETIAISNTLFHPGRTTLDRTSGVSPESRVLRFPALDLARIAAALSVVFFHWGFLFNVAAPAAHDKPWLSLEPYARYGYLGVPLFFLISGFLIVQSADSKTALQFMRARASRLYPAYVACCVLTYAVVTFLGNQSVSVPTFLYNLTMLNGVLDSLRGVTPTYVDGVYWTLAVEWKFYGLVLLLIALGQGEYVERFLWMWAAACLAYVLRPSPWLETYLIASWGAYFIAGAIAFRARAAGWTVSRALLFLFAFGLCMSQAVQFAADMSSIHHQRFDTAVVGGLTASFFLFFLRLSLNPRRAHGSVRPWIAVLGALSYPVYLLHQQIGAVAIPRLWSADTKFVLLAAAFALLILLAAAVHFGIERSVWVFLRTRRRRRVTLLAAGRPE